MPEATPTPQAQAEREAHLIECPKCDGLGYRGPDGCGHCSSTGRMAVVPQSELALMEMRKDDAYLERNQVVAALAKCFPSGVARTAIEGWSEDWHGCVYIDLPTGQVSWHFHDSQAYLFDGLPAYVKPWDGHDTPEKYRRVAALAASSPAGVLALIDRLATPSAMREALQDLLRSNESRPSCQAGLVARCLCRKCATERARAALTTPPPAAPEQPSPCAHEWVSARNEVIKSGLSICTKCKTFALGEPAEQSGKLRLFAPTSAQPAALPVEPPFPAITEAQALVIADKYGQRWKSPDEEGISFEKSAFFMFLADLLTERATPPSAQAQEPAHQAPSGWVLVPVEPTQAMIVHGSGSIFLKTGKEISLTDDEVREAYRAMLSAAPSLAAPGKGEG